jgi:hypothetical protein
MEPLVNTWFRHVASPPWGVAAVVLFLLHASCYLYFFVDDEGITLVYANNLLHGHGLAYAPSDGRSEGYSNFLHVFVMAALLAVIDALHVDRWWTFVAGGLFSLACGAILIALVWRVAGRLALPALPRATAAVLLALSAPLAVWSNSSLETVPFALAFMALVASTLPGLTRPGLAALAAIAVMLLRVDGALFAGVWLGARWIAGDAGTRRTILLRVLPVVGAAAALYIAWRWWYFGAWLSLPLQTKVAHKLAGAEATVVWTSRADYLRRFVAVAGWPVMLGVPALAAGMLVRRARNAAATALVVAATALVAYIGVVGDWMFGFRFLVPLLAPMAVSSGLVLAWIEERRPRAARAAAAIALAAAGWSAVRFVGIYEADQRKPAFWRSVSIDPARRFGEYYEALEALRPLTQPGMRLAYHEAGFVPFMLGVENIDMLGLTSRFIAGAPTLDAIFTDVGRYYPVTDEPAHHAVHAYLVYRGPELLVVRSNWMRTANAGRVPPSVLHGYYDLVQETRTFAIYRRSSRPADPARVRASGFLENLAHPAYAERIALNGVRMTPAAALEKLPSLTHGGASTIVADPSWSLHIDPHDGSRVHELYVDGAAPPEDIRIEIRLVSRAHTVSARFEHIARAGERLRFRHRLASGQLTDTIDIRFTSVSGRRVAVDLRALRVMGQRPALRDHLARHGIP